MKKTVCITGATSGIGRAFADYYGEQGCSLILIGRNEDRLRAWEGKENVSVLRIAADLSDERACHRLAEELKKYTIDIFINNAGFGVCGAFSETDLSAETEMLRVNVMAVHILMKAMVRQMERQGGGVIVNVASSAGLLPAGPYMAAYYAGKSYVVSLTKAVAEELRERGSNVYVCALCPGPVDTGFSRRAKQRHSLPGISAEVCVRRAVKQMDKRRTILIPELSIRGLAAVRLLIPEPWLIRLTGRQQKKKI